MSSRRRTSASWSFRASASAGTASAAAGPIPGVRQQHASGHLRPGLSGPRQGLARRLGRSPECVSGTRASIGRSDLSGPRQAQARHQRRLGRSPESARATHRRTSAFWSFRASASAGTASAAAGPIPGVRQRSRRTSSSLVFQGLGKGWHGISGGWADLWSASAARERTSAFWSFRASASAGTASAAAGPISGARQQRASGHLRSGLSGPRRGLARHQRRRGRSSGARQQHASGHRHSGLSGPRQGLAGSAAAGPIPSSVAAARERTLAFWSFRASASAGTAAGPILSSAPAARERSGSSGLSGPRQAPARHQRRLGRSFSALLKRPS